MDTKASILIATPCYGGMVTTTYLQSILNLISEAGLRQVQMEIITIDKDSLIPRARNNLVRVFLRKKHTHLMFIDSDIGFHPYSVFRLLEHNKDIMCGVYPKKSIMWDKIIEIASKDANISPTDLQSQSLEYPLNTLTPRGVELNEKGIAKVKDAPTGFMMVKREVFDKMRDHYPELKYMPGREEIFPDTKDDPMSYAFFDTMIDEETKQYLSEDYAFCRRWQKMGGDVWVDFTTPLAHTGQYTYTGSISSQFIHENANASGPK